MENDKKALRFNEGKPQLHYILFYRKFLESFSKVLEQGAHKYGYGNFTLGGKPDQEYLDSAMRHLVSHFSGELYDEDMGTLHLAHCIWNLITLLEYNMSDTPSINPKFDQQEFLDRWADMPKNEVRTK